ncbi:MAG: hypothetical protein U1E89_04670 [Burkholderiaceae bacterium]
MTLTELLALPSAAGALRALELDLPHHVGEGQAVPLASVVLEALAEGIADDRAACEEVLAAIARRGQTGAAFVQLLCAGQRLERALAIRKTLGLAPGDSSVKGGGAS